MVERRPLPRRHGNGGGLERRHGGRGRRAGGGSSERIRCPRDGAQSCRLQPQSAEETQEVQASAAGGAARVRPCIRPRVPGAGRAAHKARPCARSAVMCLLWVRGLVPGGGRDCNQRNRDPSGGQSTRGMEINNTENGNNPEGGAAPRARTRARDPLGTWPMAVGHTGQ